MNSRVDRLDKSKGMSFKFSYLPNDNTSLALSCHQN